MTQIISCTHGSGRICLKCRMFNVVEKARNGQPLMRVSDTVRS